MTVEIYQANKHIFTDCLPLMQVLTYSTFIWLGVVEDGCGVDSWPGTGPHGWLYGSNDALVNNHTDRCASVSVMYVPANTQISSKP